MTNKKRQINTSLLDSVTADMLGGGEFSLPADESLRVERILLDLVRPDPVQPRRVLPERIYYDFHSQRMTPSQALRELVQIAQHAARQNGRPFANVMELLDMGDDERDTDPPAYTPEEQLVRDLVNLAVTIRDDGQVNPLTVVDVSHGVTRMFRIETGERRYWATWLLRDFIPNYAGDGMIPCIVIPLQQSSAFRQARENTARAGLSAVALARQAALLLLSVHDFPIPDGPIPNSYYREALELDLRNKREHTADILAAMGGMDRRQFSRYKSLLKLNDEALEMADRHNIDEARLRYVVPLPILDQIEMIHQIITLNLTRKQVKEHIEKGIIFDEKDPFQTVPRPVVQLTKVLQAKELPDAFTLANYLVGQEKNSHMARARLQTLRQLLDETESLISD